MSIPAIAPARVVRFQNSENSIIGPNVAPKPAHAKETTLKMTLSSSQAIAMPISAITIKMMRDTHITCLSEAPFLNTPSYRFFENAEEAINR